MSEHTKEPWQTWPSVNNGNSYVVTVPYSGDGCIALCETPETARRIVACVNACAGIPTDDLERWGISLIDKIREDEANKGGAA